MAIINGRGPPGCPSGHKKKPHAGTAWVKFVNEV
jgi:hypothetical protein